MILNKYEYNIYSQCGEDGVIEEILKRLDITNGICCEFGAWDGKFLSNTFNLVEKGWKAIYIEGDEDKYNDLLKTRDEYPNQIIAINMWIQPGDLDEIVNYIYRINTPIDLLSIDIDGNDYYIMKSLKMRPKIIIVEPNSAIPVGMKLIHGQFKEFYGGLQNRGSSYSAFIDLGKEMGYGLVCHTGNMIFIREDLLSFFNDIDINSDSLYKRGSW